MSQPITPFTFTADDGVTLGGYRALPAGPSKAVVQIAHGISEHFGRYAGLADGLTAAGYTVYGSDHRGHGRSADAHGLGDFGPGGFQSLVDDMATLTALAKREAPGQSLVLLGHSMGSFASQLYVLEHSAQLAALVLSGTTALDQLLGHLLASSGPVTLELLNADFEPGRTAYDWLSRDEAQVDAYIADPMCGFDVGEASMQSMFMLGAPARMDPRLAEVRKSLSIYVISGERDPVVGPEQAFVGTLLETWAQAGLSRIEHRIYPGGRHEMFNETNRAEVETELIAWLDGAIVG